MDKNNYHHPEAGEPLFLLLDDKALVHRLLGFPHQAGQVISSAIPDPLQSGPPGSWGRIELLKARHGESPFLGLLPEIQFKSFRWISSEVLVQRVMGGTVFPS